MPKPRKIDLNNYVVVKSVDDLYNQQGLIIIPKRLDNGLQLPETYWRLIDSPEYFMIEHVDDAIWYQDIRISIAGSDDDYIKRVQWWVDNAFLDEEYMHKVNATFCKYNYDIKLATQKAIENKFKRFRPEQRKSYLHKFFWNWWIDGYRMAMGRWEHQQKEHQ